MHKKLGTAALNDCWTDLINGEPVVRGIASQFMPSLVLKEAVYEAHFSIFTFHECLQEGLMLKLKLQNFGHLM